MRAFSLGLAAVGLIVITPVPAAADTYLVVTNLTEEQQAIQVGAARVNYGESVWTPLGTKDAPQIIYPFHGGEVLAMDTQERCADDSGWAIDFTNLPRREQDALRR